MLAFFAKELSFLSKKRLFPETRIITLKYREPKKKQTPKAVLDLTFWNFLLKSFYTPQLKWYLISRINVYEKLHKSPNNLILWLLCHSRGQNSFTSIGEIPKPHERKLRAIRYHWLHHHDALPAHILCASQGMRAYNTSRHH